MKAWKWVKTEIPNLMKSVYGAQMPWNNPFFGTKLPIQAKDEAKAHEKVDVEEEPEPEQKRSGKKTIKMKISADIEI